MCRVELQQQELVRQTFPEKVHFDTGIQAWQFDEPQNKVLLFYLWKNEHL